MPLLSLYAVELVAHSVIRALAPVWTLRFPLGVMPVAPREDVAPAEPHEDGPGGDAEATALGRLRTWLRIVAGNDIFIMVFVWIYGLSLIWQVA